MQDKQNNKSVEKIPHTKPLSENDTLTSQVNLQDCKRSTA